MSTLQVHITAGPQAGARYQLNQSPVTFGRSPDNTLVLDVSVVSRQHGELHRDEEGNWTLINHSANGTRVGRKKVTKKPITLTDGASVTIGDTEVFRVHLVVEGQAEQATAAYDDDAADAEQPAERAPGAGLKGRSKLWIGLGVWFALCIGAIIFIATLDNDDDKPGGSTGGFWMPGHAVEGDGPEAAREEVRKLLSEPFALSEYNEALYDTHILKAQQSANEGDRGLRDAYISYQQAISVSQDKDNPLPPRDTRTFYEQVIPQLAEVIAREYLQAARLYRQGNYEQASAILDTLRQRYYSISDPENKLANHIIRLRDAAHRRVK